MTKDKQELLDALVRTDLYWFTHKAFAYTYPNIKFHDNWHLQAVCQILTDCHLGQQRRALITLPPRCLKSFCASVAFPAFCLGHDPGLRVLCTSYGDALVQGNTRLFRLVIHSDWYKRAFPAMRVSGIKDNETETVTTMNGSRYAVPIGGGITGQGADIIVVDDPIKAQDCYSEAERNRVSQTFTETISTRLNDPATGRIIVTMQRLHEDDLAGRLLARGGWPHLSIPAIAQEEKTYRIGPKASERHCVKPGALMHPQRLSEEFLDRQRLDLGTAAFSAQYLQDPVPADGEMIQRAWIKRYRGQLDATTYDHIVQSWDTAIKVGAQHDFSACLTFGIRGQEFHVLDATRLKVELHKLQMAAVNLAATWGAKTILVEDAGLGTALANHLKKSTNSAVIAIPPKEPKELRVAKAAALIEAGRLVLPADASWAPMLEKEMFGFPNARNDDLVDALSQFLNWTVRYHVPKLEARVTLIGSECTEVIHRDRYFERTGMPVF